MLSNIVKVGLVTAAAAPYLPRAIHRVRIALAHREEESERTPTNGYDMQIAELRSRIDALEGEGNGDKK